MTAPKLPPAASAGARPLATDNPGSAIAALLAPTGDVLKDSFDLVDLTADVYTRVGGGERGGEDSKSSNEEKTASPQSGASSKLSTLSRRNADKTSAYLPQPVIYPVGTRASPKGVVATVGSGGSGGASGAAALLASGSQRSYIAFNHADSAHGATRAASGGGSASYKKPASQQLKGPTNHHQSHQRKGAKPANPTAASVTPLFPASNLSSQMAAFQSEQKQHTAAFSAAVNAAALMITDEKTAAIASMLDETYGAGAAASSSLIPTTNAGGGVRSDGSFQLAKPRSTASFDNPSGGSLSAALFPLKPTVVVAPPAPAASASAMMDEATSEGGGGSGGGGGGAEEEDVYDVYIIADTDPWDMQSSTTVGGEEESQGVYVSSNPQAGRSSFVNCLIVGCV